MANLIYKTKGDSSPEKKPRVYFTCHPNDFARYFDKICDDIFKTHDCAIFYTADMTSEFTEQEQAVDLKRMNLFVVPVTYELLTTPNRAMMSDITYAKNEKMAILPFMMEPGIDTFYSQPDKFGEMQYLNPYGSDKTGVGYETKLKNYLEAVLISEEMAEKIRLAFDAYIFLSYRKKDRRYADELMRLIHNNPSFRDVAIWYDEFLTPGESFRDNIEKAMQNSKLFTLLVTPSLLEEPNGEPNFVMREEYPAARRLGMEILPAQMESTDNEQLQGKFPGIPSCVEARDECAFHEQLLQTLLSVAVKENDNNPEHNYLIGLAYLNGIDVEVDRTRALELITSSAESGLAQAAKELVLMYEKGSGVDLDYQKALQWGEMWVECCKTEYGEEDERTVFTCGYLAKLHIILGHYNCAIDLLNQVIPFYERQYGEESSKTASMLNCLALSHWYLANYEQALKLQERVCSLLTQSLGDKDDSTLTALNNFALTHRELGHYQTSHEIFEKVYSERLKAFGESDVDTILAMNNLAYSYRYLNCNQQALSLEENAFLISREHLGSKHPQTLQIALALSNWGSNLENISSITEIKKNCKLLRSIYGKEHNNTLMAQAILAGAYKRQGDLKKALLEYQKTYKSLVKSFGENHPWTLTVLDSLALTHHNIGEYAVAFELFEKVYAGYCIAYGKDHPRTISGLRSLAFPYILVGNYKKAGEIFEEVYNLRRKVLGEYHPDTIEAKEDLRKVRSLI